MYNNGPMFIDLTMLITCLDNFYWTYVKSHAALTGSVINVPENHVDNEWKNKITVLDDARQRNIEAIIESSVCILQGLLAGTNRSLNANYAAQRVMYIRQVLNIEIGSLLAVYLNYNA